MDAPTGPSEAIISRVAREFGTPSVVIDLDVVERNIVRTQAICDAAGVASRPHIKTHKNPDLAKRQIEAGAIGITCQKIGEAEVMAEAGIADIMISYNLIGEEKMARLARVAERTHMTVAADNPVTVDSLKDAAAAMTRPLDVVVECDTGRKRAGVVSPTEAVELAARIKATPGLNFAGLLLYPPEDGWPQTRDFVDRVRQGLAEHGLSITVLSTGGTPNMAHIKEMPGATEHRAGTSIFNDRMMVRGGAATMDDLALHVVTMVVSRAEDGRGILDAGSKTLTSDSGGFSDFGIIREYPDAKIAAFAEEHGFLDLSGSAAKPQIGEVVSVVPNHVCVVVNMVDEVIAVRGEEIVGPMPVAARGRIR